MDRRVDRWVGFASRTRTWAASPLSSTSPAPAMDDAPPTPLPPPQYRARLLAALDHTSPYASPSPSQLPPVSSGLPPPLQTPARMRTQSPLAYDDDFQATARALSQKRSFSEYEDDLDDDVYDYFDVGPSGSVLPLGSTIRNGGEFTLRYDTETPLRRIDVGGDDQDLRCVPAAYLSMQLL